MQWSATFERELGWQTGLGSAMWDRTTRDLIWSPDLNQVPSNTAGYDAVRKARARFTDWNVVTTRANDPRSNYDALGFDVNKRLRMGWR